MVGETPNLAARLQALAEPGEVVIAERTRRLVGGLFELEAISAATLKGFAEPVRGLRVLGEGGPRAASRRCAAPSPTPLVGREQELGLLLDRWQRAKEGEGQVVLLAASPASASRAWSGAARAAGGRAAHALSHFCSPYHQTSALRPVVDQLERAAGLRPR